MLFCLVFAMLSRLFIAALWSPAGKGLTSWLLFVMFNCVWHYPMWYSGSGVVLDCIGSWSLLTFLMVMLQLMTSVVQKLRIPIIPLVSVFCS